MPGQQGQTEKSYCLPIDGQSVTSRLRGLDRLLQVLPETVHSAVLAEGDQPQDQLHPEEASSISDRAVARRVESFRLGRAAARTALESLGAGRPPIPVGENREPIWPDGIVGSISHAGGYAVAVVAHTTDIAVLGVDLEEKQTFSGLKERVAFGEELKWLEGLDPAEVDSATFEIFSAKEAVFKAFYPRVRRYFGFEAAHLKRADSGAFYVARLIQDLDPDYPPSRGFQVDIGWHENLVMATVCLDR